MDKIYLDHLALVAPSLAQGVAYVEDALGVTPGPGGQHALMGTHNRLVQLGTGRFLEIIARDPSQADPPHRRWFGLSDLETVKRDWAEGRRLRAYIARTNQLDVHLSEEAPLLGVKTQARRGDLSWHFGVTDDGSIPYEGAVPYMMEWGPGGTPSARMAQCGLSLTQFIIETPHFEAVTACLQRLNLVDPPLIRRGRDTRLLTIITTPHGPRLLT